MRRFVDTNVLSVQVLQEFYVSVTRKLKKPLSSARALSGQRFGSVVVVNPFARD